MDQHPLGLIVDRRETELYQFRKGLQRCFAVPLQVLTDVANGQSKAADHRAVGSSQEINHQQFSSITCTSQLATGPAFGMHPAKLLHLISRSSYSGTFANPTKGYTCSIAGNSKIQRIIPFPSQNP